jgi:CMP-N-acetylneuraminate monooxygenase
MNLSDKGLFDTLSLRGGDRAIDISAAKSGINFNDEVFYRLDDSGRVEWVVSRICDHSNGKLRLNSDRCTATCPLHNWRLSLDTLQYENVQVTKARLPFCQENRRVIYSEQLAYLSYPKHLKLGEQTTATIRFLAHACVEVRAGGLSIVSDPWIVGPCFTTGWWHSIPPPADALDVLARADAIFLSHNHPDHMHLETLKFLPRNKPLLIPPFESNSVEKIAREMGFTEIHTPSFGHIYELDELGVYVSILPSGDFRDDSGLVVAHGDFSALLAVDANRLNQYILPQHPSVLFTSFASGATGYPLCFEMYSDAQKAAILTRNRNADLSSAERYVAATQPIAYVPYAGYFTEAAPRDRYIRENNQKNTPATTKEHLERRFPGVAIIDPTQTDVIEWTQGKLMSKRSEVPPLFNLDEQFIADWIFKIDVPPTDFGPDMVVQYFIGAAYRDDLILFVVPTDDDFRSLPGGHGFIVDFRHVAPKVDVKNAAEVDAAYKIDSAAWKEGDPRLKRIRVRQGSLYRILKDGLPWEDLSIGFQCRIHRTPDVYNSRFWFYFTNVYIGSGVVQS